MEFGVLTPRTPRPPPCLDLPLDYVLAFKMDLTTSESSVLLLIFRTPTSPEDARVDWYHKSKQHIGNTCIFIPYHSTCCFQLAALQSSADELKKAKTNEMEQIKSEADAENKKLREDLLAEAEEYAKKIEAMEGIYSKRIKDMEEQREKEATVCFSFSNTTI